MLNPYTAEFLKWNNPPSIFFWNCPLSFLGILRSELEVGHPTVLRTWSDCTDWLALLYTGSIKANYFWFQQENGFNPLRHRYSFLCLLQQMTFENIVTKEEIAPV